MRLLATPARPWFTSMPLIVCGVLVGLLLSLRVGPARRVVATSRNVTSDLSESRVLDLRARQQTLKQQLALLRDEQATLQREATSNQSNLEEIRSSIDEQKLIAGLTPLRGPGVVVTLDDSASALTPDEAEDPNRYIIHQQQLVTLVGVLWNADAEAIAINDQRVTDQTSIYCVGSTVMVNQEFLAPPFTIRAIGDPQKLEDAVSTSHMLADLWNRQRDYGLVVSVKSKNQVQVPAYTGSISNSTLEVPR